MDKKDTCNYKYKRNYTITTMCLESSVLIKRSSKTEFVIQLLEDGKSEFISDLSLKNCKTFNNFIETFLNVFDSKHIFLSADANSKIVSMLSESSSSAAEVEPNPIPYSVVDLNSLLLVRTSKNGFEIKSFDTGNDKFIPNAKFCDNTYKYPYDFIRTFVENNSFSRLDVVMSVEAYNEMLSIMAFNRLEC